MVSPEVIGFFFSNFFYFVSGTVTTVAGGSGTGNMDGSASVATFSEPWAVAVSSSGDWFIGDTTNNRIRMMNTGSEKISTLILLKMDIMLWSINLLNY